MILFSSGFVFWFWSLTSTWLQLKMTISPFTNHLSCSFRATEPDDLVALQSKEWDPIVDWFNERWACFYDPMCMHLYYTTRGCGLTHPGIHHPRPHWLSNELLVCINKRGKKTKKKKNCYHGNEFNYFGYVAIFEYVEQTSWLYRGLFSLRQVVSYNSTSLHGCLCVAT